MKKTVFAVMFALIFSALVAGQAMAADVIPEFTTFDMVSGLNDTAVVGTYGWDETPWIHYVVDPEESGKFMAFSITNGTTTYSFSDSASTGAGWASFGSGWDAVKEAGTWQVYGDYDLDKGGVCEGTGCGRTSFIVTPEPVSMVLFGLGGLPLAAGLIRRKKA